MSNADEVVAAMCQAYAGAVNASDSEAYGKLFAADAIRIPPRDAGTRPRSPTSPRRPVRT